MSCLLTAAQMGNTETFHQQKSGTEKTHFCSTYSTVSVSSAQVCQLTLFFEAGDLILLRHRSLQADVLFKQNKATPITYP
jgi:hypothetical protein